MYLKQINSEFMESVDMTILLCEGTRSLYHKSLEKSQNQ